MFKQLVNSQVSRWVQRFEPLIPRDGQVLDLACGNGRNTVYLASRGHQVVALDLDISGLPNSQNVTGVEADLEDGNPWPLKDRQFNGIVVCNYLYRPLFPTLINSLSDNSVLIYETFASGNEQFGSPQQQDFLLQPGELIDAFGKLLEIVAYEHGIVEIPRPAVIERIVAVRKISSVSLGLPVILPEW